MDINIIEQKAKAIQEECHKTAEYILRETKGLNYQDATNVFMYRKLAELEYNIEVLFNSDKNVQGSDTTEVK